jgi:uncharacterized protein YggE
MRLIIVIMIVLMTVPAFSRELLVDGVGVVSIEGDIADLQFRIRASGALEDAVKVKNNVELKVNNFFSGLAELDIKDVSASQISIDINTDRDRASGRTIKRWEIQRPVYVALRDLDKLDDVIRLALENDIEGPRRIVYRSSKYNDALIKSRELAVANSKTKAKDLAQQYGTCLGAVQNIESTGTPRISSRRRGSEVVALAASGGTQQEEGPPIYIPGAYDPEAIQAVSSVVVSFALEDC